VYETFLTTVFDRVRFAKNANSPVRWRLLADGVSGKIPLIDQRAILELAFRMWSEVIPLKFHEVNGVDIVHMDVVIAFAKRQSHTSTSMTSVCPSVTLVHCDHTVQQTVKMDA